MLESALPELKPEGMAARSDLNCMSVPARFAQQARLYPDALAISGEQSRLSYAELDRLSNRIAHRILEAGADSQARVALLLHPGPYAIAAMLGALKAGTIYVPLDPSYPEARTAYMIEDADVFLLLTDSGNREYAARLAGDSLPLIDLDTDVALQPDTDPGLSLDTDSLAYILYTSGSTGQPKGVLQTQRNLLHFISSYTRGVGIRAGDRLSLFYSFSFSASLMDIYGGLLNGATVFHYDLKKLGLNPLPDWLRENRITIYHSVPTVFRHLMDTLEEGAGFPEIRAVDLGGEPVYRRDVEAFRRHFAPGCLLVNHLAFTEASVTAQYPIDHETPLPNERVCVGYLAPGMKALILDEQGEELPAGEAGELAVQSRYLSPGYWRKPELTAASFSPAGNGQERIYRTGDLGRILPDGRLEHLGRKDARVKIRGFSIEVAEIEQALLRAGGIKEAAVVAREDTLGDPRLAAYLVSSADTVPSIADLRALLAVSLPDYMLPSAFIWLKVLPLTESGKVNRRELPAPEYAETEYIKPQTPTEADLAQIWMQVLRANSVGTAHDFFALGGHSLHAMQAVSRIRRRFGVELPLQALFETPTLGAMAARIDSLCDRNMRSPSPGDVQPLPVSREGALPLSFAQERLWFLDQLEPGSSAYNMLCVLRLEGPLDLSALKQTLAAISERHESLRTVFTLADGAPGQVILTPAPQPLEASDLRALPSEIREQEAHKYAVEFARQPYDLEHGPLWRTRLLRLEAEKHLLVVGIHHIATDGWSRSLLFEEIAAHYAAFHAGEPSPLPALPLQYADYAAWQREWLSGEVLQAQRAYWIERLAGLPTLQLPTDHPRPPVVSYRGATHRVMLDGELTQGLKELSRQQGVTLYMTLLAAFNVLLARYSGQEDIVIGSNIANRSRSEVEGLIGFFANTIVLRMDLGGDPSFRTLLKRVRQRTLEAYTHQEMPFEQLVEALQPERSRDRNPLFQVILVQHNPPLEGYACGGLEFSEEAVDSGNALFDLTFIFRETAAGLEFKWEYNPDLWEAATIHRMHEHWERLLEGVVLDSEQRIWQLPLLTKSEEHRLLVEWNDTRASYPRERCLHELFEAQVERTPDAIAVTFEGGHLTYQELNGRANQLAHYLCRLGVGPETLVGLCLHRSLEMVVGLLGILKAGGAYLPLDPALPLERLTFMMEDAQIPMVLSQEACVDILPNSWAHVISLDTEWELVATESRQNCPNGATPDNLAYVIYTSGTTGLPKGAMIRHQGLVNYLFWASSAYDVAGGTGSPVHSPLSFDLTITSMLPALLAGRTALLLPESSGVEELSGALRQADGFSLVKLTPAHLELLSRELTSEEVKGRTRAFIVGGEALFFEQIAFWQRHAPRTRIINEYGPTETVVGCCTYECTGAPPDSTGMLPIGRPISNTTLYVLGRRLALAPVGVAGELYIGGDGLARGYFNRAELTAEKFVPDPFSSEPGRRLYRTGDLCRYLPDGNIEFLGRVDHQVKIRGYRIEPGEIENVLLQHPHVREAVVLAREDVPGDKRLVGYIAGRNEALNGSELKEYLREKLPEYMVPSAFVFLEALPLTDNGKVDRKALPIPEGGGQTDEYIAPETAIEQGLAKIWSQVLNLAQVGIHDNFFALGGHSLLVVRLLTLIEQEFAVSLPLATIFEAPTIATLAAILNQKGWTPEWKCLVPIRTTGTRPPFFWLHHVLGDILYTENIVRYMPEDVPVYGVQSRGLDGNDDPLTRIEDMAEFYIREMRSVQPEGPYYLGGYSLGIIALEVAQQLQAQGEKVQLLVLLDPDCPTGSPHFPKRSYLFERKMLPSMYRAEHQLMEMRKQGLKHFFIQQARVKGNAMKRLFKRLTRKFRTPEAQTSRGRVYILNIRAAKAYRPRPYPGQITYFYAAERHPDMLHNKDTRLGWSDLAEEGLEVHLIPGHHNSSNREPHVKVLGQKLSACIERAHRLP